MSTSPKQGPGGGILRLVRTVGLAAALILFGLVLLEGISSGLLLVWDMARSSRGLVAERSHTRYDDLLGWFNKENVFIEDLYGKRNYLRTNSQGFRANEDYDPSPPAGKLRIICSGDSFTLGYGVDNDQTWCQILTSLDKRLQTVNLGQGGYGIGQAYLWYERDGARLEHGLHLFTFITADFWRMRNRSFHGYGKPFLTLRNSELVVENVPVPKTGFYAPWLARNIQNFNRLRIVQVLRSLLPAAEDRELPSAAETQAVLLKIIEELGELNLAKGSLLAVVLLPTRADYASNQSQNLRRFLRRELAEREIPFFDLVRDIRELPARDLGRLFIEEGSPAHALAGGHYSVKGNEYIARLLYEYMLAMPAFSSRLEELGVPGSRPNE